MADETSPELTKQPLRYPEKYPARRRTRSPHPGVVLVRPDAEHGWRARYVDASGKRRKVTLERVDAKTADTRKLFAQRLSEQLQRTRSDAKAGVLRTVTDVSWRRR